MYRYKYEHTRDRHGVRAASVLFGQTTTRPGLAVWSPDEAFYLRQIVRQTGAAPGRASPRAGVAGACWLGHQASRRTAYFQANQRCPVFPELRGLLTKTAGVADASRCLATIADQLSVAFVFGSVAQGLPGADTVTSTCWSSGIGAVRCRECHRSGSGRLGRDVNPTVYRARVPCEWPLVTASSRRSERAARVRDRRTG